MADNIFIDSDGRIIKTSPMVDEHTIIKITEKTPSLQNIGKIVAGDTNSNILTFEMNRYYDGVDLYTKDIRFIVSNGNGIFLEKAVNLQYNDTLIRFSWVLSYAVTCKSGNVNAAIEIFGTENGLNYSLKTTPFTLKIENSIDATDITVEPPENWFVDFETRLQTLENSIDTSNIVAEVISNMEYEDEPIDFTTDTSTSTDTIETNSEGGV